MAFTPNELWRYPLLTDRFVRQSIVDLAEDMHGSLEIWDAVRVAALRRTAGVLGVSASAGTFAVGSAYMSFNIDHLAGWFAGGQAVTATAGPTLAPGLYRFDLHATVTATVGTPTNYLVEFERATGPTTLARRRFLPSGQPTWRMSAPVWIPGGSPQQVKVKVTVAGGVGTTVTIGRLTSDSSPRLSWSFLASA